ISWASRNRPLPTWRMVQIVPAGAKIHCCVSSVCAGRVTTAKSFSAISWASRNRPLLLWLRVKVWGPVGLRNHRWESPSLAGGVAVVGGAGHRREVLLSNLVGVQEPVVAELPDRDAADADPHHDPSLGVVGRGGAGHEPEVPEPGLIRVEEPAAVLVADGVD